MSPDTDDGWVERSRKGGVELSKKPVGEPELTVGTRPDDAGVFLSVSHADGTAVDADMDVRTALAMAAMLNQAAKLVSLADTSGVALHPDGWQWQATLRKDEPG